MADVYQMVTDKIIKQLENGRVPWKKPWIYAQDGAYNRVSKQKYSFLNQMLLNYNGEYASFKQWTELGGKIKKWEKSEFVVFWKMVPLKETEDEELDDKIDVEARNSIPLLRYYPVFHISQVEGVKSLEIVSDEQHENNELVMEGQRIIDSYSGREGIDIKYLENIGKAFYSRNDDCIVVPEINQFRSSADFYSTIFHEMVHSTGNKSRLNRFGDGIKNVSFGDKEYSFEELIAEIGAAMLCETISTGTGQVFENSVAYIQGWLKQLRNDRKFVVSASSKAKKAVEYILGVKK